MACEICGRSSCTRCFHSLSEQEEFDTKTGRYAPEEDAPLEDKEETETTYNSNYAAALQDLKMFIHSRLQAHPELQCELGFIWERLNALKTEHFV